MVESTFDKILNFIIPPAVIMFLLYTLYRIPIVKDGVDALRNKISDAKERRQERFEEKEFYRTIQYE